MQTDPIGYKAGINLYAYCRNNPIIFIDAMGLCNQNNWSGLKESARLTGKWALGVGNSVDAYDGDSDFGKGMKSAPGVQAAREAFKSQNYNSETGTYNSGSNITAYQGSGKWDDKGKNFIWQVGSSATERFIGSYNVTIQRAGLGNSNEQIIMVENTTSFSSFTGGLLPFSWEQHGGITPMANIQQYIIWREPLYNTE